MVLPETPQNKFNITRTHIFQVWSHYKKFSLNSCVFYYNGCFPVKSRVSLCQTSLRTEKNHKFVWNTWLSVEIPAFGRFMTACSAFHETLTHYFIMFCFQWDLFNMCSTQREMLCHVWRKTKSGDVIHHQAGFHRLWTQVAEVVSEPENVHGLTMTSASFRFGQVTTCNQSQQQPAPVKHRPLADRTRVLHQPELMSVFYCLTSNSTFIHSCLEIKTNVILSSLFLHTTARSLFEWVSGR